jgi:hypothetical protein
LHLPVECLLTIMINRAEHRDVIRLIKLLWILLVFLKRPLAACNEIRALTLD